MKRPLLILLLLPLSGCADFPIDCNNTIIQQLPSPDARWKAVVFQRDCGATTGFSTQVSIIAAHSALPNDGGNIFVADDNHGLAPSSPAGGPKVSIRWLNSHQLKIAYPQKARTFAMQTHYQGLTITYQKQ